MRHLHRRHRTHPLPASAATATSHPVMLAHRGMIAHNGVKRAKVDKWGLVPVALAPERWVPDLLADGDRAPDGDLMDGDLMDLGLLDRDLADLDLLDGDLDREDRADLPWQISISVSTGWNAV